MSKLRKTQHSWSMPSSGNLFSLVASKKEFILKHAYNYAEDLIKGQNTDIYDTLRCSEVDCRDVHRAVRIYFRSFAAQLSEYGEISRNECKLLIDAFYCNVFANSL